MKREKTLLPCWNLRVPRVCCHGQMFFYLRHRACAVSSLWSGKERPFLCVFLKFRRQAVHFLWHLLWWAKVSLFLKHKERKKGSLMPQIVCQIAAKCITLHWAHNNIVMHMYMPMYTNWALFLFLLLCGSQPAVSKWATQTSAVLCLLSFCAPWSSMDYQLAGTLTLVFSCFCYVFFLFLLFKSETLLPIISYFNLRPFSDYFWNWWSVLSKAYNYSAFP